MAVKTLYEDTSESFKRWAIGENWWLSDEFVAGNRIYQEWYSPSGHTIKKDWLADKEIIDREDN